MLKYEQKESVLLGLQMYEKLDKRYYILTNDSRGMPYILCPYWYCRKRDMTLKDTLPYYSRILVCDTRANRYDVIFCRKDYGMVWAAREVAYDSVQKLVDDFYGATQRIVIKEYDGRNHPTTLLQEAERIRRWEQDKFKDAKWEFRSETIKKIMEEQ